MSPNSASRSDRRGPRAAPVGVAIATLLLAAAALLAPASAAAKDYYACECQGGAAAGCQPGSDVNSGASPANAWRSYPKINGAFRSASCGDRFLFCEGGSFGHGSSNWNPGQMCPAGNELVVSSYDPGNVGADPPRPLISASGSAFLQIGSTPGIGGMIFENLHIRCTSGCEGQEGIWLLHGVHRFTVRNFEIEGFHDGISVHPHRNSNNDFVLEDSLIHHNRRQGFFGGAPRAVLRRNVFHSNGKPIFDHAIYQAGTAPGEIGTAALVDMKIIDNLIYNNAIQPSTGKCDGTQVEFRGGTRLEISGNRIYAPRGGVTDRCWGIAGTSSQNGYGTESCVDCVISNNRIENYPRGIDINGFQGGRIENNRISLPDESGLYGCEGIQLSVKGDTPVSEGLLIRNNSIWSGRKSGDQCHGITIREGTGHRVVSNAVQFQDQVSAGRSPACIAVANLGVFSSGGTSDYNVCAADGGRFAQLLGGSRYTLAAWRNLAGLDVHSRSALPGFLSPRYPSTNFGLAPGGAAVGAGHPTLSSSTDAERRTRRRPRTPVRSSTSVRRVRRHCWFPPTWSPSRAPARRRLRGGGEGGPRSPGRGGLPRAREGTSGLRPGVPPADTSPRGDRHGISTCALVRGSVGPSASLPTLLASNGRGFRVSQRLRAAVIGAGRISEHHLRFLQASERAELVGVCDLSPALARYSAERFSAQAFFTDPHEMLAKARPQIVHVLTPPHTHVKLAMDVLLSGAHVVVEKPAAPSCGELRELQRVARSRDRWIIEDQNCRFSAPFLELQRLLAGGRLGEVSEVEIRLVLDLAKPGGRYGDTELLHPSHALPGGAIHEFLPHLAYLALQFVPEVRAVHALWQKRGTHPLFAHDDLDALVLGERTRARLRFSFDQRPETFRIAVRATGGSVETDLYHPLTRVERERPTRLSATLNHLALGVRSARAAVSEVADKLLDRSVNDSIPELLERSYRALLEGGSPPVSYEEIEASARLIDALLAPENRL